MFYRKGIYSFLNRKKENLKDYFVMFWYPSLCSIGDPTSLPCVEALKMDGNRPEGNKRSSQCEDKEWCLGKDRA